MSRRLLLLLLPLLTTARVDAEVVVSMTPKALGHIFKKEMSSLRQELLSFRPSPFRATYLGLEVTIDQVQVVDLKMPRLSYEIFSEPSQMTFKLLGGSARLLGQYSAVYKTKREGQFELILDHFRLAVPVKREGLVKFTPSADACTLEVDETMLSLTPVLPEQISEKIKTDIMAQLQNAACSHSTTFFSKLNSQMTHFAEATDISQGNHPSKFDVDLLLKNAAPEDDSAVHVAISESVVNAELSKLFSAANTRFLWNDVPEIKTLLEKCTSPECKLIQDGDLHSSFYDRPTIRIREDDTVSVHLPLSTTLTSSDRELFRIRTNVHLTLEDVVVGHPENGLVAWSAKFRVDEVKILQTASSRSFQKFATTADTWIQGNKKFIENLLNSYLQGSLPVHLSSPLTWSHRLHAHARFSTSSFHFQVHPHFAPSLRVLA